MTADPARPQPGPPAPPMPPEQGPPPNDDLPDPGGGKPEPAPNEDLPEPGGDIPEPPTRGDPIRYAERREILPDVDAVRRRLAGKGPKDGDVRLSGP